MSLNRKPRILAFYLPQYHPVPENDEWWGRGFTEWTNVASAKKFFPGHYQPKIPADLGFYDLRVPETRAAQAELAEEAGIDGFCYWHYWFGDGKELLQRPFDEVVISGKPNFPFCLAWANENWYAKLWKKNVPDKLLVEQKYLGIDDYTKHFYRVLPAFRDPRYIRQDGKPIFMVYKPLVSDEIKVFMNIWQKLAIKNGLEGIYFIAHSQSRPHNVQKMLDQGFDAVNTVRITDAISKSVAKHIFEYAIHNILRVPYIKSYRYASKFFFEEPEDCSVKVCPSIIPCWDHTPRSGARGYILTHSTPDLFYRHVKYVLENVAAPFVFVKSWNEWAEGNYMEPDLKFGKKYILALRKAVDEVYGQSAKEKL